MRVFDAEDKRLTRQFENIRWIEESGEPKERLLERIKELEDGGMHKQSLRAATFEIMTKYSRIAVDETDIFQDKLFGGDVMGAQRYNWERQVLEGELSELLELMDRHFASKTCNGNSDFGHTSPGSRDLMSLGFAGLYRRIEKAASREGLSEKQMRFYEAEKTVMRAYMSFCKRMADAVRPYNAENADCLLAISERAPENTYEAMQLLIVYFFLHEYVAGTRVRTLGRLDVLLSPFVERDIEKGTFTEEEIRNMLKFFLNKFWSAKVPFDLPFCISGMDEKGGDVTCRTTYMIVETYDSMDIYSPKIHVRVSPKTPAELIKRVLRCIRGGNSSFVFVNDSVAMRSLEMVGIEKEDSWDYVPIGCYEPAVWGKEIGCTGNGSVNGVAALSLVFTGGVTPDGFRAGIDTGIPESYGEFLDAVKAQLTHLTKTAMDSVVTREGYYGRLGFDPILSATYESSVEKGVDVMEGGAKYNNSSLQLLGIASLCDGVAAVKRLVYDEKRISFTELAEALKNDWKGYEKLRAEIKRLPEKFGNGDPLTDSLAKELSGHFASVMNNAPNGRGGVFKAACFSIDYCFSWGYSTGATPDGRCYGEPFSKNLCAATAMDRKGITALINSVTAMDHSLFPNGSVLDVVLHPSAVSGEDGLFAFYGILMTYFKKGGFAMHCNVFDAETLKKAKKEPEKYSNLQVRVCGWNAYFVNLSEKEQDAFIRQAENTL